MLSILSVIISNAFAGDQPILLDSLGNDKGSAYAMQTKIVSCSRDGVRKTHFTWSHAAPSQKFTPWQSMSVWVATYNHQTGEIENHTRIGPIFDNHGTPCLAVDGDGFLHIVYGPHHHPFIYRKSKYPNNSSEWEAPEIISFNRGELPPGDESWRQTEMIESEPEWTYPIIKIDKNNCIHVAGSLSHSAGYVRKINGHWEPPRKIFTATRKYCRYNVMLNIDGDSRVSILAPDMDIEKRSDNYYQNTTEFHWFESTNGGDSFTDKGIVLAGHVQGNGNLAYDPAGNIHFLVMERNFEQHRWQYHVFFDGEKWQRRKLAIPDYFIWDASMTIDDDGTILIFTAANQSDFHWRDASNEIFLFTGKPDDRGSCAFEFRKIVARKPGLNRWLPALEENQVHSDFDPHAFFTLWTEEVDLQGNYTTHRDSGLLTKVFALKLGVNFSAGD